ncbi:aminotransferase class I/II-fold pyridoxal phosphate-dependent enzyme [Streptomyces cavernicola]|uniref:Aminotransferase class I/II-fold pyridoxal phosphate-dependent enzyme n=1 Tax=Streptomyces cavernicola TaxID=3043613 RepID=A0ABT6SBS7_9ACTN|nr:aminotransferase class I/II-fold pyridoxal phosphate-dependent enzyme [Streptomyces sp. B-S-A6]MDI3405097.1 aminotransferase class I/II-fold pyridoxal phosphate-dependent enzyme [Streptomyces sp. B-S-A6]
MNTRSTALAPAPSPAPSLERQLSAPYAEALRAHAGRGWLRLNVPGHAADAPRFGPLAELLGPAALSLDFPPLLDGIDLGASAPLAQAERLAAEAWGARRTWFLTNGASQGNQIASLVTPALGGDTLVVQRSVHSSVIDGLVLSGLDAAFVQPSVDADQGIAHGVDAAALAEALARCPRPAAAYVVSPSYFGAVADVRALADVAHAAGVPLIVDEAWGAHFGFHPSLPANALSQGADLVTSSTHKLGGSLTQSAMLHLGHGPFADRLEPLVDRAFRLVQSTSASALLLASLDLARAQLAQGGEQLGASIDAAERVREAVRRLGRYRLVSDSFGRFGDIAAADPLRIAVDTRSGGIPGHEARRLLYRDHQIMVEVATDAAIVAVVGAGSLPDTARFVEALHCLPAPLADEDAPRPSLRLPSPGPARLSAREAFLRPARLLPAAEAVGQVSADTLAAYPPGIPNVLPGEVITAEVVDFLQRTASAPYGHVRGAHDATVSQLRVVDDAGAAAGTE